MTRIKICGLSREADIYAVNEVLPDYIGFIFARSRRQVDAETAYRLKELLRPEIVTVGVFVDEEADHIRRLCERGIIDFVQLHGNETPSYINQLRDRIQCPIIKAIRVSGEDSLREADKFPCDYLLLDTYHKERYGGTGEGFDWALIPKLSKPYFLAGGIDCNNALKAIHLMNPYCLDVSSSVETEGYKDRVKIGEMVRRVREGQSLL